MTTPPMSLLQAQIEKIHARASSHGVHIDYEADKTSLNRLIAQAQAAGDLRNESYAWRVMGSLHLSTGHLEEALSTYQIAVEKGRQANDLRATLFAQYNMNLVYSGMLDYVQAVSVLQEILAAVEKANDKDLRVRLQMPCFSALALALVEQGQYTEADRYISEFFAIWDHPSTSQQRRESLETNIRVIRLAQVIMAIGEGNYEAAATHNRLLRELSQQAEAHSYLISSQVFSLLIALKSPEGHMPSEAHWAAIEQSLAPLLEERHPTLWYVANHALLERVLIFRRLNYTGWVSPLAEKARQIFTLLGDSEGVARVERVLNQR